MVRLNHKAQIWQVTALFGIFVFVVLWFGGLGGFLGELGQSVIATNNMTGIEAFFVANLNIWIFICIVLSLIVISIIGGQ